MEVTGQNNNGRMLQCVYLFISIKVRKGNYEDTGQYLINWDKECILTVDRNYSEIETIVSIVR